MAKKSEAGNQGLSSIGNEEMVIDIRPDGIVSTHWLTTESNKILKSVGREPERFARISNFCG